MIKTVAAVCLTTWMLGAAPASASPPPGSAQTCPADYQAMTLPQLIAQAERNGVGEQRARALFARVNKNQDDWICQAGLPGDPATSFNFIDNQAVGLDR